ncbi:anti-anti-sigma factor [Jatrophihabitans endophyticus]|uniref:Anti-anti-sigma factor n=1 Tax=Jatrophihabitans endophyticus TaxID=1206085 RepID=A0A1M5KPA9_9ACTN|nr:STAS domain-containing protein [Jatrophihabitans endophyticus]SHG54682.1 anti-anti-sigma factor [Jatrophihabitans endophyticus]
MTSEHSTAPHPPTSADAPLEMSVETVRCDATHALVRVAGELRLATSAPLLAVLRSHHRTGRRFVRLDVSRVTHVDDAALPDIVRVHQDLLATRGTLVVTGVRSAVARALRRTGLDEVLFVGGARADGDTPDGFELRDVLALAAR